MTSFSPSPRRLALACALLASASGAARAGDSPPAEVVLRTSDCATPYDTAALRHAVDVELAAMHVEHRWEARESDASTARVTLSAECEDETGAVALRVWANTPRLIVERSVPLGDVPASARARTLALVISEALGPALGATPERPAPGGALDPTPAAPRPARGRLESGPTSLDADPGGELFTTVNPYGPSRPFRIAAAAQARVALRDTSSLLAFEFGASGPLAGDFDWTFEASHASTGFWAPAPPLDVSWWSTSLGADFVHSRAAAAAIGPRLSLGHVRITSDSEGALERTLVTQLGVRGKVDFPVAEHSSVQLVLAAQHKLGVLALTNYTGLDHGLNGWVVSCGLGYGVEP